MAKTKTLFIVFLLFVACAGPAVTLDTGKNTDVPDSGGSISFAPPPDASRDDDVATARQLCIATECLPPLTTCPGSPRCAVDLSRDPKNCGACGADCSLAARLSYRMSVGCSYGECKMECEPGYEDCNGNIDDGCEVAVGSDPANCGGCGVVCSDRPCIQGHCGCPPDKPDYCDGQCVNLLNDNANCGACGKPCGAFACLSNPPINSTLGYVCAQGQCMLGCKPDPRVPPLLDCNNDLPNNCRRQSNLGDEACQTQCVSSDGCETMMGAKNCGACGRECEPGFECRSVTQAGVLTVDCVRVGTSCPSGEMACFVERSNSFECVDVQHDPLNCGGCLVACVNDENNHIVATCQKGVCLRECRPGFADCDGLPDNGCEVNLNTDVKNCGACGVTCEYALGQPCVAGQCLMTECDAGGTTR